MIDLPLLAPFLPEIGGAMVAVALIILAAIVADKLSASGGGGFLGILSAPVQAATSLVHSALNAVSSSVLSSQGGRLAHLIGGTAESLQALIDYPARLFAGVHAALAYLWNTALPLRLQAIIGDIHTLDKHATTLVGAVADDVSGALAQAQGYADRALSDAITNTRSALNNDINAARTAAEAYADKAVQGLKSLEDAGVSAIADLVAGNIAINLDNVDAIAKGAISEAEVAVKKTDAAATAALNTVKTVAVGAADDLKTIEGKLTVPQLATLIASIPALATLVAAISTEAGLGDQTCRQKVKGICGTDPLAWAGLLAGAAFLTGNLSLRDILPPARVIFAATKDLIEQAA